MADKSKWKKEGKDWGDAILLRLHLDPEEMRYGPDAKHAAGMYSARDKTVNIADQRKLYPESTEEAHEARQLHTFKDKDRGKRAIADVIDDSMKERGAAVISHELAHWQLGHSAEQADKEARVRSDALEMFGTSDWDKIEKEFGEGYVWGLETYEDLVTEFEVRLLQEVKGWNIGDLELPEYLDTFLYYFKQELGGSSYTRYGAATINRKRKVFEAANTAINNLLKKGILSKKQSKDYRRKIWTYAKQKYSS